MLVLCSTLHVPVTSACDYVERKTSHITAQITATSSVNQHQIRIRMIQILGEPVYSPTFLPNGLRPISYQPFRSSVSHQDNLQLCAILGNPSYPFHLGIPWKNAVSNASFRPSLNLHMRPPENPANVMVAYFSN